MIVRSSRALDSHDLTLRKDQGTRERLSKAWMPLGEFIERVMEGLCRGDAQIPVGQCVELWEQFEKGKLERMNERKT